MSPPATTNGRPRKQLSDQLDRLDTIIDALAEGLPGAVADACREGARAAMKDAIIEIVTNPELRALLAPATPAQTDAAAPPPAPEPAPGPEVPGLWGRLKAKFAAARDAVGGAVTGAKEAVAARCRAVRDAVGALGAAAGETLRVRRVLLVGLGIGAVVGVACLVMPQTLAAAVGAVSAAATTVAVQTGSWLRRAARRVGLLS